MVKNFLINIQIEKGSISCYQTFASTNSPEAYRYYMYGKMHLENGLSTAREIVTQAIDIDSNFTCCNIMLAFAYANQGLYEEAKKWVLKAYEKRDQMP